MYNLVIGIIVSIYILGNIEGFSASAKKLMYTVFSVEAAEKLREVAAPMRKNQYGQYLLKVIGEPERTGEANL